MNYKTIIYILTLTLVSAIIGGGAVYLATNSRGKNNSLSESVNSSESVEKSSTVQTISSIVEKQISSSAKLEEAPVKTEKSTIKPDEEKPTGQKFTGWLGSTNIEMYLDIKQDKITGKYYNSYDKKWYKLDGYFQSNDQTGTINLNEYDGNLVNGNLSFSSTNPAKFSNQKENNEVFGYNGFGSFNGYGIAAGLYYTNTLKTLSGYYNDKKGLGYDLFVSTNPADIDYFTDITKEYKVVKLDSGNQGDSAVFESNGSYYFTYEDWMLPKDMKVGDKLKITGKIRSYNNSQGVEIRPWVSPENQGQYESTSQGIFQIGSAKKI
jgi:hypothetical protein